LNLQVYDDNQRPRIDAIVCIHIYTLFHIYGRSHELKNTYDWIYRVLLNRAYRDGTLYYSTPDYFLFALSRLGTYSEAAQKPLPLDLLDLLHSRCKERVGAPGDALAIAMRIIACRRVGIPATELQGDVKTLKGLQCEDGGWPFCGVYLIPSAKTQIGNRGVSTAMAVKAIELVDKEEEEEDSSYAGVWVGAARLLWASLRSYIANDSVSRTLVVS
jgi:hypothetical protein